MTIPKHDVIRLRLTTLEKQDWAKAAGGKGKLSDWIRAICNAAAENQRMMSPIDTNRAITPTILGKPQVVEDAIQRDVSEERAHRGSRSMPVAQAGGDDSSSGNRKAKAGASAPASAQCPRWFHHRPGAYCGACKKVIGK